MNMMKSATAGVKETMQNTKAKMDEMAQLNKAGAAAKAERKNADTKAGRHDAKSNYHAKQAEILREYEQKKANNAAEKEQKKGALHQTKAEKHANKTGAGPEAENQTTSTPPAAVSENPAQTSPTDKTVKEDQDTLSTPVNSDAPDSASAAARDGDVTDSSPTAADTSQSLKDVPSHGSGVPTHSTLHSDVANGNEFDHKTTQTMGGTPNTGSYM